MKENDTLRLVQALIMSRVAYGLPYHSLDKSEESQAALGLPISTPTERLLALGIHSTYAELSAAVLISQRNRLSQTAAGRTILSRHLDEELVNVPTVVRRQITISPVPKNMNRDCHAERRAARVKWLRKQLDSAPNVTYVDAASYDRHKHPFKLLKLQQLSSATALREAPRVGRGAQLHRCAVTMATADQRVNMALPKLTGWPGKADGHSSAGAVGVRIVAGNALASWGDLQPLRSKMSQKTRPTHPRADGAQGKASEARRKSTVEDSAGSKARSVSRDNKAPVRRDSVKPPAQNASKRSSSQHESRKAPAPQETSKKQPGPRDTRSTSRQPESRKSNVQPDGKGVPSRRDSKTTAANAKASSRQAAGASKTKDALASRVSNADAKSPSRHGKVVAEASSSQKHPRTSDKDRESEKVVATSSGGTSEKRPRTTHRTKAAATGRPQGDRVESKRSEEAESKGNRGLRPLRHPKSTERSRDKTPIPRNTYRRRPSTSHRKENVIPDQSKSETPRTRHSSVTDDNYDDDFEDYESDFENDDGVDEESSASSAVSDSSGSDSGPASGYDEAPSSKDATRSTNDILLAQQHSETNSEQKLKEQSHWKSEPVLEVEAKPPAPLMPTSFSTYSLVSYLTAQKKEESKKVLSKAQYVAPDVQERAKDILDMVSLDTMTYQVFDVPPITYDVYISTFGRADAKQVLVQTDLGDEEECQTDAIELEDKWTQQPPHDYKGFGGGNADGTPIYSDSRGLQSGEEMMNLLDFLKNSSDHKFVSASTSSAYLSPFTGNADGTPLYSDSRGLQSGEDMMNLLDFLKNSSNLMLRVMEEDRACETRRNLKRTPEVEGFSDGYLQLDPLRFVKGCPINFVRFSRPCPNYLVTSHDLTSMLDGSLELWDLRDKFCLFKNVVINEGSPECQAYNMKMPAYSTVPSDGGYNVWSLDEEGTLVSWAVAAVKSEPEGSLSDLGLAPGATLRLVLRGSTGRAEDLRSGSAERHACPGYHGHRIDDGRPLSCRSYEEAREGLRTFGAAQLSATRVLVTTDIVASRNGALRLHFLEYEQAVWEWDPLERTETGALLWSPCAPTQFYVTTAAGGVVTWDLSTRHDRPTGTATFPSSRVLAMDADGTVTSRTSEHCLALAMDEGAAQVHLMGPTDNGSQLSRDEIREKLLNL
ncbi:hypothetical protein HPB50_022597 [Hyalomma asiaticum]|uniref:Uncharacterized protein n=1 Tax=Hyalomma asiaticum TaxID=266040 RepID=A0ACB7SAS1_HYAAI|nr:hypothetical protein HPB50_022597 [Hyalomma asiaticum]